MRRYKGCLSLAEFQRVVRKDNRLSEDTINIARAVLVEGHRPVDVARETDRQIGSVYQMVRRIYVRADAMLPPGCERVTAVMTKFQAWQVRREEEKILSLL